MRPVDVTAVGRRRTARTSPASPANVVSFVWRRSSGHFPARLGGHDDRDRVHDQLLVRYGSPPAGHGVVADFQRARHSSARYDAGPVDAASLSACPTLSVVAVDSDRRQSGLPPSASTGGAVEEFEAVTRRRCRSSRSFLWSSVIQSVIRSLTWRRLAVRRSSTNSHWSP
jgi:hypothetical protein